MAKFSPEHQLLFDWSCNPVRFCREALHVEPTYNQQLVALEEVAKLVASKRLKANYKVPWRWTDCQPTDYDYKIGISIMSGQGPGKDALASWLILWMLTCFPTPVIAATAPTGHQLKDVLWSQIYKFLRNSEIKEFLTIQSDKIFVTHLNGKEAYAVARTCNVKGTADEQGETLQGFHEKYMMLIVDEASGVPDPVFRPLEGTLTDMCNFIVLIFNPTRNKGFAIDSQFKERERWICLHWDCEESERVSKDHIEDMARKYGRDSNAFRIRVKGLPPRTGEKVLVEWEWAIDAVGRELIPLDTDPEVFGIDLGAGGDDTVLYRRKGPVIYPAEIMSSPDAEVVIGWILKRMNEYEPSMVMFDTIGIGWAIGGPLRERAPQGCEVIPVNVSESPPHDDKFYRLRDELCWRVRESFAERVISTPDDPVLINEITGIHYDDERSDGKIKIEAKKDMRKRGAESTNRLDALALTAYYEWSIIQKMTVAGKNKKAKKRMSWRVV